MSHQYYQDSSKIFFISDTHFGHENIIKYCNRPFKNTLEMREELILRWNKKVPPDATVFHMGDFAFADKMEVADILNRLNGRIILIRGNHDAEHKKDRFQWLHLFEEVHNLLTITILDKNRKITLCHYPLMVWDGNMHGSWMLHGHCHGTLRGAKGKILDVGIDCHPRYEPYSYAEVNKLMDMRSEVIVDGHGQISDYGRPTKYEDIQ